MEVFGHKTQNYRLISQNPHKSLGVKVRAGRLRSERGIHERAVVIYG